MRALNVRSALELLLAQQLKDAGLFDGCERDHVFAAPRKWAFDFAWPDLLVAIEVEGGQWIPGGGRHQRPQGFERDAEKYAQAVCRGWRVLRVTGDMVNDGRAIELARQLFAVQSWNTGSGMPDT